VGRLVGSRWRQRCRKSLAVSERTVGVWGPLGLGDLIERNQGIGEHAPGRLGCGHLNDSAAHAPDVSLSAGPTREVTRKGKHWSMQKPSFLLKRACQKKSLNTLFVQHNGPLLVNPWEHRGNRFGSGRCVPPNTCSGDLRVMPILLSNFGCHPVWGAFHGFVRFRDRCKQLGGSAKSPV